MKQNVKIYSPTDFPTYLPKLNSLYDDLFSGGKGFRSKLIKMIGDPLLLPNDGGLLLSQTIEFIHNASLLHDDLVDRSHLRRNKTTAWLKYTPEYAVLAGDYLLARVMVNLSKHGNIKLLQYTSEMISDLLEGEWIQDSLVRDWDIQLTQLDRVHDLKTASLFKWCFRSPFLYLEMYDEKLHETLDEMGKILGQLFQRSDDLLDFNIRNYENKAVLGDLKSGYLNSFSVFLTEGLSSEKKKAFIQSQTLADVKKSVDGEKESASYFDKRCDDFDRENIKLIDLYKHLSVELEGLVPRGESELLKNILPLADWLYWRKK